MDLSLCAIVKNEAETMSRCLNSVKDLVDEMVVLDTGSTDGTPTIAQNLGARVYSFAWCNDFSAARNESLKYARGQWVLVLDADEVLLPEAIAPIRQAIQNDSLLVVNLLRQEVGATQSPYSLVSRLFRRHPKVYFARPYHAMIDDSVAALLEEEPHWQIGHLPEVAMLHEGYRPDLISGRGKAEKARMMMEGFLATHPQDPYVCSKLGALYFEMGDRPQGLELLERGLQAIQAAKSMVDPSLAYELHYHLGSVYSELQDLDRAEFHYQAAAQQPLLPALKLGAINNLGGLLKEKGDLLGAETLFRRTLEIDPGFACGHYNLGMTLRAKGNLAAAIACYQEAIALKPDYADAYQNLGVALLKLGQIPASLDAFRQAIVLHEPQNPAEATRLRQGLASMGFHL